MTELDEIRAILRDVAANQQQAQIQQQQTDRRIEAMLAEQQQTDRRIAEIAAAQQNTQRQIDELGQILRESIPDLTEMVGTVLNSLDGFSAELRSIFASDNASRASDRLAEARLRNEFRSTMLGLQSEARNILRDLAEMRRQSEGGQGEN